MRPTSTDVSPTVRRRNVWTAVFRAVVATIFAFSNSGCDRATAHMSDDAGDIGGVGDVVRGRSAALEPLAFDGIGAAAAILDADPSALDQARAALRTELEARNDRIRDRLHYLETTPGPAGPKGVLGPAGPAGSPGLDGADAPTYGLEAVIEDAEQMRESYAAMREELDLAAVVAEIDVIDADVEDLHRRLSAVNLNPALMPGATTLPDGAFDHMFRISLLDPNPTLTSGQQVSYWRADEVSNRWDYDTYAYDAGTGKVVRTATFESASFVVDPPPPPDNSGYTIEIQALDPIPVDPPKITNYVIDAALLDPLAYAPTYPCGDSTLASVAASVDLGPLYFVPEYAPGGIIVNKVRFTHFMRSSSLFDRLVVARSLQALLDDRGTVEQALTDALPGLGTDDAATIAEMRDAFDDIAAGGPLNLCRTADMLRAANEVVQARAALVPAATSTYVAYKEDPDALFADAVANGLLVDTPAVRDEMAESVERIDAELRAMMIKDHATVRALARELGEGSRNLAITLNPDDYHDQKVKDAVTGMEISKAVMRSSPAAIYDLKLFPDVIELAEKEMAARQSAIPVLEVLRQWSSGGTGALVAGVAGSVLVAAAYGPGIAYVASATAFKAIAANMTTTSTAISLNSFSGLMAAAPTSLIAVNVIIVAVAVLVIATAIASTVAVVDSENNLARYNAFMAANPEDLSPADLSNDELAALVTYFFARPR